MRRVEYCGFRCDDGLRDVEGKLLDTKPHAFEIEGEGEWAPNESIHQKRAGSLAGLIAFAETATPTGVGVETDRNAVAERESAVWSS